MKDNDMNYEKTINGLCYVSQGYLAEILGVKRHTIKAWQDNYGLPVIKDDKYCLCCAPVYINWYCVKEAHGKRSKFPKIFAVIVAAAHLSGDQNINKTLRLLEKGMSLPRQKALLYLGMAAEWIRVNLKKRMSYQNIHVGC